MQFLRTAIWVVLAVAVALFAKANWYIAPSYSGRVPVKLIGDAILEVRLPLLIVGAFLLGLVPMWLIARVNRWRMERRLHTTEQALAANAAALSASSPTAPETSPAADEPVIAAEAASVPPLRSDQAGPTP